MPTFCRRDFLLASALLPLATTARAERQITDSAGRSVRLPDTINRVMAAGPPASALVTMLAPERLIGWNRKPYADELPFLPAVTRALPELGRLTGRGGTANLEVVLAAKPDLIIDFGSVSDTYVSLANRVQDQTGVPYVLIDGRFANSLAALRLFGEVLDARTRADTLAQYCARVFAEVDRAVASVAPDKRPRVYLARGPRGLETGNRGSINTEILERAGAINVVDGGREGGGLLNVSLEQVIAWNPGTIVTLDPTFFAGVKGMAGWKEVEAVRRGRVYLSPRLPFGWIDAPPSINRLIGLQWLSRLLMPDAFSGAMRDVTRDFFRLFYQVEPSDADLDRLLAGAA